MVRDEWRYRAVLIRDRFDRNRDVKDLLKAQELYLQGEAEYLAKKHPLPLQCNLIFIVLLDSIVNEIFFHFSSR